LEQVGLELQDQVECRAQQDRLALLELLEQDRQARLVFLARTEPRVLLAQLGLMEQQVLLGLLVLLE
jgi:hypothetical protein